MQGREDNQAELLRTIVDGAPVVVVVVDADLNVTFCSDASERAFGWRPDELVGKNIIEHVHEDSDPLAFESVGSALGATGLRLPMLFTIRKKDGSPCVVEVTANSQMDDPTVGGMIAFIRPWNEQSRLDDILESLAGDEPLAIKLDHFVQTMAGETLAAVGAVLHAPQDDWFTQAVALPGLDPRLGAEPRPDDPHPGTEPTSPWGLALRTGQEQLVWVDDLPDELRTIAVEHGYRSCWAFPVHGTDGTVQACLVMWRSDGREIEESYRVWIRRLQRLTELVLEQEQARARLTHAAKHDPLTGLHNRAAFFEYFQDVLDDPDRSDYVGVLYLDLDGFKPVNDKLGHGAGDAVLVAIARRLSARVRAGDLVARMGGDEFAVVCPELESPAELEALAERLAAAAREPVQFSEHVVEISASVGASLARAGSCSIDALVDAADAAMYKAKTGDTGGYHLVTV
jgi:diguanylate cyclase (GGDEF)-like protein/PAS domain S-box-containing protein